MVPFRKAGWSRAVFGLVIFLAGSCTSSSSAPDSAPDPIDNGRDAPARIVYDPDSSAPGRPPGDGGSAEAGTTPCALSEPVCPYGQACYGGLCQPMGYGREGAQCGKNTDCIPALVCADDAGVLRCQHP
jgi:hypothetical protein